MIDIEHAFRKIVSNYGFRLVNFEPFWRPVENVEFSASPTPWRNRHDQREVPGAAQIRETKLTHVNRRIVFALTNSTPSEILYSVQRRRIRGEIVSAVHGPIG